MTDGPPEILVTHHEAALRFEATVAGHLAVCEYVIDRGRLVLTHTFVPAELRGRGVAEQLVRAALAFARTSGRSVVPQCSYVATFIARHREFQSLVAES